MKEKSGEEIERRLFREFSKSHPYVVDEKMQSHLVDQYKLYVEMADRVSGRRLTANTYFLSVNTALLGFVAYLAKDSLSLLWVLGAAGMALCWLWYRIIRSYRDLNTTKFSIIHKIEKRLPLSLYAAEWIAAGHGMDPKRYHPLTHIETGVPIIFLGLHTFVFLRTLPWGMLRHWHEWVSCSI